MTALIILGLAALAGVFCGVILAKVLEALELLDWSVFWDGFKSGMCFGLDKWLARRNARRESGE